MLSDLSNSVYSCVKPFLLKLRTNLILHEIALPGAISKVRYSANADDILVTSNFEIEEVSKEIEKYESMSRAKINCDESVCLPLDSWKDYELLSPYSWTDGRTVCARYSMSDLLSSWFKNWYDILERLMGTLGVWSRRRLSLKNSTEVCDTHILP